MNCKKETNQSVDGSSNSVEEKLNFKNRLYITASSLKIRSEPNLKATSVGTLEKGDSIRITEEGGEEIEVEGNKGKWGKITVGDKTGWIFLGFVSNKPPQLISDAEVERITRNYNREVEKCEIEEKREYEKHKNDPSYQSCAICGCDVKTSDSLNNDKGCKEYKLNEIAELGKQKGEQRLSHSLFQEYNDKYCLESYMNYQSQCSVTELGKEFMRISQIIEDEYMQKNPK